MVAAALAAIALAAAAPAAPCVAGPSVAMDEELRALYESGVTFEEFIENARRRRDEWHSRYAAGRVPAGLLARARAVAGSWRLLVVAEDWCGDSANTIPFLARLVEQVEGLEMRIVDSGAGRPVMHTHPTPDGRPATPTIVLLDEAWNEAGCFVERPAVLQDWFLENPDGLEAAALFEEKYAWYDGDAGATTIADVVVMMEGAASGSPICR